MAQIPAWFIEVDYLNSKLQELNRVDPTGGWNLVTLNRAIQDAGFTPLSHFQAFGSVERTSPNQFFDANQYLANKAAQLNSLLGSDGSWDAERVALAIDQAGLTIWQHFQQHGWQENVNPSYSFDIAGYLQAKAEQMGNGATPADVKAALIENGLDPITHFEEYGRAEGIKPVPVSGGGSDISGETYRLRVDQDEITGTDGNDTFKAVVAQNAIGDQVNTLGSGDFLDGKGGIDTLDAKVTSGVFSGGSFSMPIQPEVKNIEIVKLQAVLADVGTGDDARDQVFVNAKDMNGVQKLSSSYSDADLTVMNMNTLGVKQLSDLTIGMEYTGNRDSKWDESDFTVLFDQDYLTPKVTLSGASVQFLAMNEDGYDASKGANPLGGVFFRELKFTLNGTEFNVAELLGENPAGAGDEITTYDQFLAAVQNALVTLKAANPANAALQTVQASFGDKFTTDIDPVTGVPREGTAIRLTVDGQTDGAENKLSVVNTDLEVARAAGATVPNNNRYERAEDTPPVKDAVLGINVELEKVGLAGDGGALVIGSMNKGDDHNVWNASNTVVEGTTSGIEEFYITVKGDASKSSSLSELRSTNNNLRKVTVTTDAAVAGDKFANLTIGNSNSNFAVEGNEAALKDVQIFDAAAFKGNLSLKAELTEEVVAKYLTLKDQASAAPAADNKAFVYTGGSGNDNIDLTVSAANLAAAGTVTREDMSVEIKGGSGNDTIKLSVVNNIDGTGADPLANGASDAPWYVNQALNENMRIDGGAGNDTIWTPGSGDVVINAGEGDDTVYSDNSADKGVFVFNATTAILDNLTSDVNDSYNLFKTDVTVTFKGFEATARIADVNGEATDLDINQAIKKAINDDPVLNKLLVAEDGPANTLVVRSLIDGELVVADLALSLTAPAESAITAADIVQLKTWWGAAVTSATDVVSAISTQIAAFVTKGDYATAFATDGSTPAVPFDGTDSGHASDNEITGGTGNDVIVLSTSGLSNDTVVYAGLGNGNDSIVNFTTGEATAAVAEVFTVAFGFATPAAPGDSIEFDDVTVDLSGVTSPETIAAAVAGETYANWTAVDNGNGTVTFTAQVPGAKDDVTPGDFTVVGTASSLGGISVNTQGADAALGGDDFLDFTDYGAVAFMLGATIDADGVVGGTDSLFTGVAAGAAGDVVLRMLESTVNDGHYTIQKITVGADGAYNPDATGSDDTIELIGTADFGAELTTLTASQILI